MFYEIAAFVRGFLVLNEESHLFQILVIVLVRGSHILKPARWLGRSPDAWKHGMRATLLAIALSGGGSALRPSLTWKGVRIRDNMNEP
jgi:hypothetical protein